MPACYNQSNYTNTIEIIVNHQRRPFRINIGFLVNQPAGYTRDIPFEFEAFYLEEDIHVEDLEGVVTLERTKNGVHAVAEFSALTEVECGRCLEPFNLKLHTDFEEVFTLENHTLSEEEAIIPEDGNLDFESLIREYLLLELPINPVCETTCKGLCSVCGQNLNVKICRHQGLIAEKPLLTTEGVDDQEKYINKLK